MADGAVSVDGDVKDKALGAARQMGKEARKVYVWGMRPLSDHTRGREKGCRVQG